MQCSNVSLKYLSVSIYSKQADEDNGGGLDIDEFGNALKMAFQHEVAIY